MKELIRVELDIEPVTWGNHDLDKRERIRCLIREKYLEFSPAFVEQLIADFKDITVIINCFLTNLDKKDIDNLAKIPIDAFFFSAKGADRDIEVGHKKGWENKITSLKVNKISSNSNLLEVIIYGS